MRITVRLTNILRRMFRLNILIISVYTHVHRNHIKSLFSNKLYNILHEFKRALIYNGSKSYPNHAK